MHLVPFQSAPEANNTLTGAIYFLLANFNGNSEIKADHTSNISRASHKISFNRADRSGKGLWILRNTDIIELYNT